MVQIVMFLGIPENDHSKPKVIKLMLQFFYSDWNEPLVMIATKIKNMDLNIMKGTPS